MKIFSASKLNTCLIEYYISYIENIKIKKYTEALLLGNLLHKGLELYTYNKYIEKIDDYEYFNCIILDKDVNKLVEYFNNNSKMKTMYEKIYENNNIEVKESMLLDYNEILKLNTNSVFDQYTNLLNKAANYLDSILIKEKYNKIYPEEFFKVSIKDCNALLYGIIDLVIFYDNKISIIDYKISKTEATKFQIYFYGYLVYGNTLVESINLFYLYPKLNKITHVKVNNKILDKVFYPFVVNKINSFIMIENIIEPLKLEDKLRDVISDEISKMNNDDVVSNQKYIAGKYNVNKIINNINIISALISDARVSRINNSKNYKCSFCDYKRICTARSIYPSMML